MSNSCKGTRREESADEVIEGDLTKAIMLTQEVADESTLQDYGVLDGVKPLAIIHVASPMEIVQTSTTDKSVHKCHQHTDGKQSSTCIWIKLNKAST